MHRAFIVAVFSFAFAAGVLCAQATFQVGTNLALVRFRFHPKRGVLIQDLRPEDIELREDGVAQKIAVFEGGRFDTDSVPVEISLLFDCSASVVRIGALNPHVFSEKLLDEFPNVSIAIYGFSDSLVRFSGPTRDPEALRKAMDQVRSTPPGNTALFGSIAETVHDAATTGVNVVRMLVIFSDGQSTSANDVDQVVAATRLANQSGTALFPVMIGELPMADKEVRLTRYPIASSISDFLKLAPSTGGKILAGFTEGGGGPSLPFVLKSLANEIRSDYVAGFYLPRSGEQKPHKIEVVLRSKDRGRLDGANRIIVH
ncbi:MAG: VWA domain-containing protein [Bryobacteraceae bacterium]|jgi:VWFA-related protein